MLNLIKNYLSTVFRGKGLKKLLFSVFPRTSGGKNTLASLFFGYNQNF